MLPPYILSRQAAGHPATTQEQVKLGRLLGAGAAACVYAAEWRGQRVAVKLAHPSSADPKAFARHVPLL